MTNQNLKFFKTFWILICNFYFCIFIFAFLSNAYALTLKNLKKNFLQGDYKACIQEGEKILANSKNQRKNKDEFYYLLGLSYLKEGNYLRSFNTFEIILNEFRNSRFKDEAKIGLADSYFLKGDYNLASLHYRELLNNKPRTKLKPGIYYRLSQIGVKTGNKEQEGDYLAKLKKEFPLSPEARENKELFPLNVQMQMDEKSMPLQPPLAYMVQVGAFSNQGNAKDLSAKLNAEGYTTFIVEALSANKKIFKVRVGNFKNQGQAREAEKKLQKEGYPTKIIP
jgi:tetratricopeptide (TPR) repeat protein